jgi:uncharacterized protein YerC
MTKLSRKYLDSDKFGHYINNLWSGFTLMGSKEDIRLLFRDLFTHTEYKMFAKRLEISRRLLEGQGYDEIIKQMNVTERTIANINNTLAEKGDGFRKVHSKLSDIEQGYRDREAAREERLSNPFRGELPGQNVLRDAIAEGAKYADKKLTSYKRRKSAKKKLIV